jgi:hypothetical protein
MVSATFETEQAELADRFHRHVAVIKGALLSDAEQARLIRGEDQDYQEALSLLRVEWGMA